MYKKGIDVEFNGSSCVIMLSEERYEYAIGEMVCEFSRFEKYCLKDFLMNIPGFRDVLNRDRLESTIEYLGTELRKKYPPVISEMIYVEFYNYIQEFYRKDTEKYREGFISELVDLCGESEFSDFVFKDSGYVEPGMQTVGQLLLSLYLYFEFDYKMALYYLESFVNTGVVRMKNKKNYKVLRMSKRDSYLQDINYRILFYENRLNSVFTIKSMMSLCLFEMAHIYAGNVPIVKCKNCGQFFVPKKRSDTLYCDYPSPDNPEKTCKEIGAQKAWLKKEKTDDVTKAYRKVYMRYKMKTNRHPDDTAALEKLDRLTEGIKEWRQKMATGNAAKDEFMCWLEKFQ